MSLVFLDLETTGLEEWTDHILEAAIVVVDDELNETANRSVLVDPRPSLTDEYAASYQGLPGWSDIITEDVVMKMHTDSGLLEAIDVMKPGSVKLAEEALLTFMSEQGFVQPQSAGPLCGNGVAHFDRHWLAVHMPRLLSLFTHRHVDTRTLSLVDDMWGYRAEQSPVSPAWAVEWDSRPVPSRTHRALPDCRDSIAYLDWFRARYMPR